jgi:hypothetical protein
VGEFDLEWDVQVLTQLQADGLDPYALDRLLVDASSQGQMIRGV